jgi:hypothetical protein
MPRLTPEMLDPYLARVLGEPVRVVGIASLRAPVEEAKLKAYGYGEPVRIECEVGGRRRCFVLSTMQPSPFGHEQMEDRAQALLLAHRAYNHLPGHVRSVDVGAFTRDGALLSLANIEEPHLLTEFVEGRGYFEDLFRLRDGGELGALDLSRADALCDYLVGIHSVRGGSPGLYVRRCRELVGHGECIMGLADSYPLPHGFITAELLEEVERLSVSWRWRLRQRTHRVRQVHGDFHPWNILFREGTRFTVLDRSRGEWGEPADDVACLTMNYVFFALQRSGSVDGALGTLFQRFWSRYLQATGDSEMLEVVAPFLVFRALVMASPVWYPALPESVRRALFTFMRSVLCAPSFVPAEVNAYHAG